ncbi:DUF1385 domain-containing protein [Candidatus Woesearchaeota archaeon]|nr:DUF1385 domain-containing protein [Candidatus Woesearchaeota archaeon]
MSNVGGQAVIEGVMMRNKGKVATAVRLPNGKIKIKKDRVRKRHAVWTWPFFRGVINLWDMLFIGTKSLLWSADQQLDEHEKITKKDIFFTLLLTFSFAVLFFIALPYVLTLFSGVKEEISPVLFNLIDGIIRGVFVLGYIYIISHFKDIKRVFRYHGAEHKTVYCYEAEKKLNVKNVKKFSTKHPRCGTSFIILVLIISIFIFSFLPLLAKLIYQGFLMLGFWKQKLILFPLRILSIPVIAGISYEGLKLSGKYPDNIIVKWIAKPGLLLQKITTKEPDKKMIETAIKALKAVL